MFSPHLIKCNMESSFKLTCSAFSKITGALETKLVMVLVKWLFFLHLIVDSKITGGYTHSSCPLQSSKLILQPFSKKNYPLKK